MSHGEQAEVVKEAIDQLQRREFKALVKEAIKEWLDEQTNKVGKWSLRFIGMAALAALSYFILTQHGWHK
jgi:fructose-1,6-bisphosphatase